MFSEVNFKYKIFPHLNRMNKIESIWYFQMREIPTVLIDIIDKSKIKKDVRQAFHQKKLGWVARSGSRPSPKLNSKPDGFMPWHATKPLDHYKDSEQQLAELVCEAERIYNSLSENQVVFIHPQRQFDKSGVLRVDNTTAIVEAVAGWPEGLSHGKVDPIVRYVFKMPSLFIDPIKIDGEESFLTSQELRWIGSEIERRLDYKMLLETLSEPLAVEFSFGPYRWGYSISAHDIMAGKAKRFQTWYDLATSITTRVQEARLPEVELAQLVEETFENVMGVLDRAPYTVLDIQKEAERLSEIYDIATYKESPSSMGSSRFERAAEMFLEPSKRRGRIVPVGKDHFEAQLKEHNLDWETPAGNPFEGDVLDTMEYFQSWEYFVEEQTSQGTYLWPTENLLKNQEVPKKSVLKL